MINYYDIYFPTDIIGNTATVRHVDSLIRKTI